MIRGTTTQFKFKLPYSYAELEWVTIKFWQPANPNLSPITKTKSNCSELASCEICVSLLPSETATFSDKYRAKVQLMAQTIDGALFGSKEQLVTVYPMRDDMIDENLTIYPSVPTVEEWLVFDGGAINT